MDTPAPKRSRAPKAISLSPARGEPTLKLFRETLSHATGDAVEGERIAWVLLRQWAGTVIRCPTTVDVERLGREQALERRLLRDPSMAAVQHVAAMQGTQVKDVSRAFKERRGGLGLQHERARRSSRPGLTCRTPRVNMWRRVFEC